MAKKTTVSSWKKKRQYTILAPDNFDNKFIGVTVASDPKSLVGRTIRLSLRELLEDKSKQHLKLTFEVHKVEGEVAHTKFKVFDVVYGYLRSKIRKGMNKIDYIGDYKTQDAKIRVKVMVAASGSMTANQKAKICAELDKILKGIESEKLDQVVQMTLFGKLGTNIYRSIKGVFPINRVEITQIRVLKSN